MISWLTTVAPATSLTGSSQTSNIRPYNPGFGQQITWSERYTWTQYQDWSRTEFYVSEDNVITSPGTFGGPFVNNGSSLSITILGTTNSTSGTNTFSPEGVTISSVISITSTQTTREYTYRATATETSEYSIYVSTTTELGATTSTDSLATTTAVLSSAATITTSQTATSSETCVSTTTGAPTIATPILATVLVADKNEVIYVANTTAATDLGNGLDAASNAAITTTRATIFPNTNTTTVISGDFQTQTTTTVFSEVSSEINFGTSNLFFSEQQGVVEYGSLPHQTELQQVAYATTAQTTTSFAFASNSTTITKTTAAETVCVLSFAAVSEYLNGQGFGAITTATSTLSSKYAPTAAQTRTFSSTQEITTPTAIETTTNSGTGTRTTTSLSYYTWTASYNSTISDALTTFARRDCGVTTSSNSCKTRQEYMSGVVDESGGLALGYSLQANLGVGSGDPFVSVEPYLLSAFPSSFVFASEIPEEGDITYTSVTFSHLSATIKAPGTGNSSSTAALETFGSPIRHYRLGNFFSSRMESGLAQNQTGYITVPGGVYYADGSTFSTPGQTTSFTKGELSAAAPRPISYIVGTPDRASANQIYWTATRNSFAQP